MKAASSLLAAATLANLAFAKTEVGFLLSYDPNHPEDPATRSIARLAAVRGDFTPLKWGSLTLPGAGGRSTFMLSLAAQTAPDVYKAWFHILRHDVAQGFVHPLDEWVDPPEGGDLWDEVRCFDGHVWALPTPGVAYYGLIYRKDIVREAGLDPENPPASWSGFREWCVRLTVPGRRALAIENRPWGFLPWVQSAGGDVIKETVDAEGNACCEADFASEASVAAAEFLQSLIRLGTVRAMPVLSVDDDMGQLFASGEIVAVFGGETLVRRLTEVLNLDPSIIGIMPFPARDGVGVRVLQAHRHFYAMGEGVGRRPKRERDIVFACLETLASRERADEEVRRNVAEGRAQWCLPSDLKRLGFAAEVDSIPPGIRRMYEDLESGKIKAATEPWVGFWQGASDIIQRKFLGLLLSSAGAEVDCRRLLEDVTADSNRGLMFDSDKSQVERARPWARAAFGAILACMLASVFIVVRSGRERAASASGAEGRPGFRIAPWLFLLPAVLSILVWSYYPLAKGAVMAFQDYRIVGGGKWTGLDNFIRVSCDPGFWRAWLRTLQYVAIMLLAGFTTPVLLALMLCEIPKGKIFFRFLYFLPHLTSALVVTLLWKLMFDPTENGFLNQLLATFGAAPKAWLQDPSLAMVCCIAPGVWAGAGVSSLIYIAAIESLPKDYYESAAIDGAGILSRLRHITFPQIAPLMVINFVGAFIAAFQGMGSIFLLTFGGPGDATQVLSLQIWKEAYNNLRFSTATTMAWFLGFALIAFTYLQIRILRKVEFRQAAVN